MRLMGKCVAWLIAAQLALSSAYALTPGEFVAIFGTPTSSQAATLTFPSATFQTLLSAQPYAPDIYYMPNLGFSADLSLPNFTPTTETAAQNYYNCYNSNPIIPSYGYTIGVAGCAGQVGGPTYASPLLQMTINRQGFDSSGNSTTRTQTAIATGWLRQPHPLETSPVESTVTTTGGFGLVFSDELHSGDSASAALTTGLYYPGGTLGSGATNPAYPGVQVINNSTDVLPKPIVHWIQRPGIEVPSGSGYTAEAYCDSAYPVNGQPCTEITFNLTDGTHTVSSGAVSTMRFSKAQWSTSCTATAGTTTSNLLTNCGSVAGLMNGERVTVVKCASYPAVPCDGTGNVPGSPIAVAITVAGTYGDITVSAGQLPAIILGQGYSAGTSVGANALDDRSTPPASGTWTGTAQTNGSIQIASTIPWGEFPGDGAYAGQYIYNANLGTNPAKVVAPTGTCSSCSSTGLTSLTLSAPASGQWLVGQPLMDVSASNCLANNTYIVSGAGGGAGAYTITPATTASCASAKIVGGTAAAVPGASGPTTLLISTAATSGTNTAVATYIHNDYQNNAGSGSDTVRVIKGVPLVVFGYDFTSGNLSTLNKGAFAINLVACPNIGTSCTNSETNGGPGPGPCAWFYANPGVTGSGTCNSSNGAYFGATGLTDAAVVTNAQKIDPSLHDLWAYNDTDNSYTPAYCWVGATAGGSPAVQSTSADPGSTKYYATTSACQTALKTYNGTRTTPHSGDPNGGVICELYGYTNGGGKIIGTSLAPLTTKPPLIITSALSGSPCPSRAANPGQFGGYGGDPYNVTNTNSADGNGCTFCVLSNFIFANSQHLISNSDSSTAAQTTFRASEVFFDGDGVTSNVSNNYIQTLAYFTGPVGVYNSNMPYPCYTSGPCSIWLALGDTMVGAAYNSVNTFPLHAVLGSAAINMNFVQVQTPDLATNPLFHDQTNAPIFAFDKDLGYAKLTLNASIYWPLNNYSISTSIFETNNSGTGASSYYPIASGGTLAPADNIIVSANDFRGSRANHNYSENPGPNPSAVAGGGCTVGGACVAQFPGGTAYTVQLFMACKTGLGPSCNSSTITAGLPKGITSATPAAGGSITVQPPCDGNYLYTVLVATGGTSYYGTLGTSSPTVAQGIDPFATQPCKIITLTGYGASVVPPTLENVGTSTGLPGPYIKRTHYYWQGNHAFQVSVSDINSHDNGTATGSNMGNWGWMHRANSYGNIGTLGCSTCGTSAWTWNPGSSNGFVGGQNEWVTSGTGSGFASDLYFPVVFDGGSKAGWLAVSSGASDLCPVPVKLTEVSASGNVLTFAANSVPASVIMGTRVVDLTTGGNVPSGAQVVSTTSNTVTLNKTPTNSTDVIAFISQGNRIPSGKAHWPTDIYGNAVPNDGTANNGPVQGFLGNGCF